MKTLQQVKEMYKSKTIDGRDLSRLAQFIPENELNEFGLELNDKYVGKHHHKEFTRRNILEQLESDVDFGFDKALDRRGISAGLMFEVVQMWNWILEEGLENYGEGNYAQYGLPLFKTTAVKYGFDNPIGDDRGNEYKYSSNADWE